MRIVVQRVLEANVKVDGEIIGKCGKGMMLLVSFTDTDTENEIDYMVNKVSNLRIFDDKNGIDRTT